MRYIFPRGPIALPVPIIWHRILKKPLFNGKKLEEVIELNNKCEIDEDAPQFKIIHKNARNLLLGMLKKDPEERLGIQQVISHPFFT